MSDDKNNPFGEKTIVASNNEVPPPAPASADKTVVFAQSNLQETFDAKTVVRSSKPAAPVQLPAEAPAKVIGVELPPPVSASSSSSSSSSSASSSSTSIGEAETNPDVRISSVAAADKPKLSKTERREARAALDRKTRNYMMAFGVVCVIAITFVVVAFATKSSDGVKADVATGESPASEQTELASETEPSSPTKTSVRDANMLGAYKTTTDVLKDFDRAAKKAQDHSIGF